MDVSRNQGVSLWAVDVHSVSKFIWPLWRAARARTSVISTLEVLSEAGVLKAGVVEPVGADDVG